MTISASKLIGGKRLRGLSSYPPAEQFLTVDANGQIGTAVAPSPDLSQYVFGPSSSIANRISRFADNSGKAIISSPVSIDDLGSLTGVSSVDSNNQFTIGVNGSNAILFDSLRDAYFSRRTRVVGSSGAVGPIGSNSYALSIQNNTASCWMEILNNGGAGKGAFFGIMGNDFQQWNYQGGHITFFTGQTATSGTKKLEISNSGFVNIYNANGLSTSTSTSALGAYSIEPSAGQTIVVGSGFSALQIRRPGQSWFGIGDSNGDTFTIGNISTAQKLLDIHQSTKKLTLFGDIEINNTARFRNVAGAIAKEVYNSGLGFWQEVHRAESSASGARFSVFGEVPAIRQIGGVSTASATYTATEQAMLQKAYDTLRTFGFLT